MSSEHHHLRTPTSALPHAEKVRRQQRHIQILTGALLAVFAVLAYSAIFDLDHWAEWIVFGGICVTVVGAMIAVHTP